MDNFFISVVNEKQLNHLRSEKCLYSQYFSFKNISIKISFEKCFSKIS